MKRQMLLAAIVAAGLMLAGCTLSLGGNQVTITSADVKAAVVASCAVVPTAEQITAAVDAANKTAATVESVAGIVCAAIAPAPAKPAG